MKKGHTYTITFVMLFISITAILNSNHVSATASTLTLTIDSAAISTAVAPTSSTGTFKKATASTVTASTNNATGYTLSISAPTSAGSDYDKLINTTDNTAKLNSISSPTTEEQYKALNATSYNNTWGYLPSKYCSDGTSTSCATNTSFLPAPTTTGDILDQTTSANSTANTYTIGMGTRIDSNTKTGKYTNSFVVKLVANAIPYTMIFDDNVVSNMPTDRDTTSMTEQVSMPSNVPTREGYIFLGWCTVVPTNNNGTDTCTGGTTYQPSATLTIDQTGTGNNFHFYAMWKEDNSMQSFTTAKCSAMSTGNTITLTDSRDDQAYTVGKLADGNCWLLDNLALDLTNSTVLSGMNENNTHASNTTLNYLKGITTRDPSTDPDGQYATAAVANWTSDNSYSAPLVNLTNKDVIPSDATSQAGQYKVGGYYNYCAATAGSYCYKYGAGSGNATEDICPKGWRMPTGSTSEEYQVLYNNASYNTYANYRSALHLPLSGYFYNVSAYDQGDYGFFWSSTRYNDYYMYNLYNLYIDTSGVYPSGYADPTNGYSVRCVLGS